MLLTYIPGTVLIDRNHVVAVAKNGRCIVYSSIAKKIFRTDTRTNCSGDVNVPARIIKFRCEYTASR